jgi:cytochrome-b5 reductase
MTVAVGIGAIGLGVGLYRYTIQGSVSAEETKQRDKIFTGGDQGWVDLKLADIEILSHNTKRFRFEFPDKDAVSGLQIACMCISFGFRDGFTLLTRRVP